MKKRILFLLIALSSIIISNAQTRVFRTKVKFEKLGTHTSGDHILTINPENRELNSINPTELSSYLTNSVFLNKFKVIPDTISSNFNYLPFEISDFNDNEFYSKNLDLEKTFEANNTITTGAVYVDGIKGDDSNSGTVIYRPKKTIAAALSLGPSKIYLKDGVYSPFQWRFDSPLGNRARMIVGIGNNVYFKVVGDELNNFNAAPGLSTSTFQMQLVTDNRLFKILRKDIIDYDGEYTPMRKLLNASDVNSQSNAWHYDEDTKILTIRTDEVSPHASGLENREIWFNKNIAPLLVPVYIPAAGNINFIRSYSNNLFLKNVNIEGLYVNGLKHPNHPKGSIYLENCTIKHAPTGGLLVDDTDYIIKDSYITRSVNDNIGVHEFQEGSVPNGIEINVKSTYAGDVDTNGDNIVPNKNGSSVHENANVIRIGGEYAYNYGPNVIDVCRNDPNATGESYMVNVLAHSSLSETSKEDFEAYQYRKMYMSSCKALKFGKVTVRSNAEIIYNNLIAETIQEFTDGKLIKHQF